MKGREKFKAALAKTITPENKMEPYNTSFKLTRLIDASVQAELDMKESEVIDFKHPKKCWVRGSVKSIEKKAGANVIIFTVGSEEFKFNYPSPEFNSSVGKCGTRLTKLKCDKDPKGPVKNMKMVKTKLECNSFSGGDCQSSPLDCVFED